MPELIKESDSFKKWMEKVDERLLDLVGLDSNSLPDIDYASIFEEQLSFEESMNVIQEELELNI